MDYRGMRMPHGFPPPQMQGRMGEGMMNQQRDMMGGNMMNQPPPGAMINPQMMPEHFSPNVSSMYLSFLKFVYSLEIGHCFQESSFDPFQKMN
ncbi:Hypothetical predicted protein [Mytilus galloprovincialis]|uniref:Uncharacterized protein n=1 Tax=Mytilus galloprovincialis TaxID=29158 RepID=A0A8B6EMZ7_MYTGA|nr:Hypothetical predicted protein [Mytilus galloprovincialis]